MAGVPMCPVVKVTSKNQITLPSALMRELGMPSHFRVYVHDGNLMLFSARLATYDEQSKAAGIPVSVLRQAYASAAKGTDTLGEAGGCEGGS